MTVIMDLAMITTKVLSSLGEPTMKALFWELGAHGVSVNTEEFDIRKFDLEMKKIFGDGANVFMEEIYTQFKGHIKEHHGDAASIDEASDESSTPIEKIERILSLKVLT